MNMGMRNAAALQRANDIHMQYGTAIQLQNAKRVSEGRDRQAEVIRELIRANSATERSRIEAESRRQEMDAQQQMMREKLMAEGKLNPVTVIDRGGRRTEYRPL